MIATLTAGKSLLGAKAGSEGTIAHFTDPYVAGKLMAMGVLPDTRIKLIRRAPLGGGIYVKVDDYLLALRDEEAACIVLK